jgi:hypothetical protein
VHSECVVIHPPEDYGNFATNFLIVFVLRIVNGSRRTFSSGTVEKSDVPVFLRRRE